MDFFFFFNLENLPVSLVMILGFLRLPLTITVLDVFASPRLFVTTTSQRPSVFFVIFLIVIVVVVSVVTMVRTVVFLSVISLPLWNHRTFNSGVPLKCTSNVTHVSFSAMIGCKDFTIDGASSVGSGISSVTSSVQDLIRTFI